MNEHEIEVAPVSPLEAKTHPDNAKPSAVGLKTKLLLSRVMDPPPGSFMAGAASMNELATAAASGVLAKLVPAGLGAALMVAVDPPANRRELFARLFVAFVFSYLFGDVMLDFAKSFSMFAFLTATNRNHVIAVEGIAGASGWFVVGGVSQLLKKYRANPMEIADDVKKVAP